MAKRIYGEDKDWPRRERFLTSTFYEYSKEFADSRDTITLEGFKYVCEKTEAHMTGMIALGEELAKKLANLEIPKQKLDV